MLLFGHFFTWWRLFSQDGGDFHFVRFSHSSKYNLTVSFLHIITYLIAKTLNINKMCNRLTVYHAVTASCRINHLSKRFAMNTTSMNLCFSSVVSPKGTITFWKARLKSSERFSLPPKKTQQALFSTYCRSPLDIHWRLIWVTQYFCSFSSISCAWRSVLSTLIPDQSTHLLILHHWMT